jgi:hypothetical protein
LSVAFGIFSIGATFGEMWQDGGLRYR